MHSRLSKQRRNDYTGFSGLETLDHPRFINDLFVYDGDGGGMVYLRRTRPLPRRSAMTLT